MEMRFKIWLEANEDFFWHNYGKIGTHKAKDFIRPDGDYSHLNPASVKLQVQQELNRVDPTLATGLKPQYLNQLINWLTIQRLNDIGSYTDSDKIPVYNLSRLWNPVQNFIHAQANNPKFFQYLQATNSSGQPLISWQSLRADAQIFERNNKSSSESRIGPVGNVILSFPDGYSWVSLDKAFCDKEGKAGNHCGNILGQHPTYKDDRIVSLRSPKGEVEATLVINHGNLAESKGPGNAKISAKFHPYLAALFLAPGPKPLPIISNFFWYSGSAAEVSTDTTDAYGNQVTIPPRMMFQPHKDTTVLDLIASDTIDDMTKEKLANKFKKEFSNKEIIENYLSTEMDDAHRKKVLSLIYPHWTPGFHQSEFDKTKKIAADKALKNWGFMVPDAHEVANWQLDSDKIIQILDYNTNEFKRLLNKRWMDLFDMKEAQDFINDFAEINRLARDFKPAKFMYEFDPEVVKRRKLGIPPSKDEDHIDNHHPEIEVDSPIRRAIKKSMTRMFRVIDQVVSEILSFLGNPEEVASTKNVQYNRMYLNLNAHSNLFKNIKEWFSYYLKRVNN